MGLVFVRNWVYPAKLGPGDRISTARTRERSGSLRWGGCILRILGISTWILMVGYPLYLLLFF